MKVFVMVFLALLLAFFDNSKIEAVSVSAQKMDTIHVVSAANQTATKAPVTNFTGDAAVLRIFPAKDQLTISGGYVTFQPGARTNWHTHPHGQMIIITEGLGKVQQWGKAVIEVKKGDIVWFPPNVKHWHGATPNTVMVHISLAEIVEGKSSIWMEKVTDTQYNS